LAGAGDEETEKIKVGKRKTFPAEDGGGAKKKALSEKKNDCPKKWFC